MAVHRPFSILRMKTQAGVKEPSGRLPPLLKAEAVVIERSAVGIKTFATGSNYDNGLRCEIQDLTELCFLFPDSFFRNLTFRDIQDRAGNLFVARLILNGMRKIMKMLYRTIRHQ